MRLPCRKRGVGTHRPLRKSSRTTSQDARMRVAGWFTMLATFTGSSLRLPKTKSPATAAGLLNFDELDQLDQLDQRWLRTCARPPPLFSASQAWNCLNSASLSVSDCAPFAEAFLLMKSSKRSRAVPPADPSIECVSSHCLAAGRPCQPASGADSDTSFHFGWKGGFCSAGNLVKNASTNSC